jgi:hypothetical protein
MIQVFFRRAWVLVALISATLAIPARIIGMGHTGKALMTHTKAFVGGTSDQMRPLVSWHTHQANLWGTIWGGLTLLAVICWITAYLRGEAVPRLALIILLLINLSLALIIV